jgi:hypothetical protein
MLGAEKRGAVSCYRLRRLGERGPTLDVELAGDDLTCELTECNNDSDVGQQRKLTMQMGPTVVALS